MGLSNFVYWLVWFLTAAIFVTLGTLILISAGLTCKFAFFTNSNFFAVFLLFFAFGIAMATLSFFLSTLIHSSKTAQTGIITFLKMQKLNVFFLKKLDMQFF